MMMAMIMSMEVLGLHWRTPVRATSPRIDPQPSKPRPQALTVCSETQGHSRSRCASLWIFRDTISIVVESISDKIRFI